MMALLVTKAKAYNLATVTSVQMLTKRNAELTIEGKPVLVISEEDMSIAGFALALTEAVRQAKPVSADELAAAAVKASAWRG